MYPRVCQERKLISTSIRLSDIYDRVCDVETRFRFIDVPLISRNDGKQVAFRWAFAESPSPFRELVHA